MNSSPKRSYFPPKKEAGNVPNVTEKLPGLMDMICKEADMRDDTRSQSQFLEDTNIIISKMLDANSVNSMLDNSEKLIDNAEPSENVLFSNITNLSPEPWHHPSENVDCQADPPDSHPKNLHGHYRPSLSNTVDELELVSQLSEIGTEKKVYIQDLYLSLLPKTKHITADILGVCFHIFSQDIEVSALNQAYTGHCAPDKEQRSALRAEQGASFGPFTDHQDLRILCRMNELADAGIDNRQLCLNLREKCTGQKKETSHNPRWKVAGVRHILGLYVGQDIPEKLAFSCYKRMMHLVLAEKETAREIAIAMDQSNTETGPQVQEDHSPSPSPKASRENPFQQYMRTVFSETLVSRSATPSPTLRETPSKSHSAASESSLQISTPQASSSKVPLPQTSRSASPAPHFVPVGPSSSLSLPPVKRKSRTGRKRKLASTADLNCLLNTTTEAEVSEQDIDAENSLLHDEVSEKVESNKKRQKRSDKEDNFPKDEKTPKLNQKKTRRSIKQYEKLCRLANSDEDSDDNLYPDPDKYLKVINPFQSQRPNSQNSTHLSNDRIITIKDLYKLPSRSKTPGPIFAVCVHILSKHIEVSPLNRACKKHFWIRKRNHREELRRKYGARFRAHNDHQDSLILKRFAELKKANLFNDFEEFCSLLKKFTSFKERTRSNHKDKRNMRLRNIIGLFVGQDIPDKLAFHNYDRLLYLVLSRSQSYVWRRNSEVDPERMKNRSAVRWTLEEDLELLQEVISAQVNIDNVADIEIMHVDWDKFCEEQRFRGRSRQNIREHWQQRIYPALVEEFDLTEFLKFRINLMTRIQDQGATFRCEIDWDELAVIFHPRTNRMLQTNFITIIRSFGFDGKRIDNAEEFTYRLKEANRRMSNMLTWPEAMLVKHFHQEKRESYMREMRYAAEKMLSDLAKVTSKNSS